MIAQEALNLAFGESAYNSLVCIGIRRKGTENIIDLAYIPTSKIFFTKLHISQNCDYYITANTLKGKKREGANLFSLKNIVIDVDAHDIPDPEELLREFVQRVPIKPHIIHYTGRGVQLWYCLEEASGELAWFYSRAVSGLLKRLESPPLKIDSVSKNITGYFRLFDTYNTKNGKKTVIEINHIEKYSIFDFPLDLDEPSKPQPRARAGAYANMVQKRLDVIRAIVDRGDTQNRRDRLLFLFYNHAVSLMERELAKGYTRKLNQQFHEPLKERELQDIFTYIDKKGFLRFKTSTFEEYLGEKMPDHTDRILELHQQGLTQAAIAKELKTSLNTVNAVLKPFREKKQNCQNDRIRELHEQGLSQRAIAKALGIDKSTVNKVLKPFRGDKPDNTARIIELYQQGLSQTAIAKELGHHPATVSKILKPFRKDKPDNTARILELHEQGLTQAAIAKELGIRPATVNKILKPFREKKQNCQNDRIRELYDCGTPVTKIAKEVGLSRQAVYNIINKHRPK